MTILDKIKQNAIMTPDSYVYIAESYGDDGEYNTERLTWKELDVYSDALAAKIDSFCQSKKPVIVYGHKNPMMLVCFIACVKSGRAYCPIDISVPVQRVYSIIDAICPDLILAMENLECKNYSIWNLQIIEDVVYTERATISTEAYVKKDDVFYIIFTSGSTGTPKGVQITRDCLDNFIRWSYTFVDGGGGYI